VAAEADRVAQVRRSGAGVRVLGVHPHAECFVAAVFADHRGRELTVGEEQGEAVRGQGDWDTVGGVGDGCARIRRGRRSRRSTTTSTSASD